MSHGEIYYNVTLDELTSYDSPVILLINPGLYT